MSKKEDNIGQDNKEKSHRKKIIIALVIASLICDLAVVLTIIFIRFSNNNDVGNNGITSSSNKYRDALKTIANKEYKTYASITDDNQYIDHITALTYSNNEFTYVSKTNLESSNIILEISFSGISLTSLESSLEFIQNNFNDMSSLNKNISYYEECSSITSSLDNVINAYTISSDKKIVDKYVTANPKYIYFALSFMDGDNLKSIIGSYDNDTKPNELVNSDTKVTIIDKNNVDYIQIVEIK